MSSDRTATIVLTGATTGIGRATALVLADRADRLILHGLEPERDVADRLRAVRSAMRTGAELIYVAADYGDLTDVTRLAREIRTATDRVDILINNASATHLSAVLHVPDPPRVRARGECGSTLTGPTDI